MDTVFIKLRVTTISWDGTPVPQGEILSCSIPAPQIHLKILLRWWSQVLHTGHDLKPERFGFDKRKTLFHWEGSGEMEQPASRGSAVVIPGCFQHPAANRPWITWSDLTTGAGGWTKSSPEVPCNLTYFLILWSKLSTRHIKTQPVYFKQPLLPSWKLKGTKGFSPWLSHSFFHWLHPPTSQAQNPLPAEFSVILI